jgi:hypothetical protein
MLAGSIGSWVRFFPGKIRLNIHRLLGALGQPALGESPNSRLTATNMFIPYKKNRREATGSGNRPELI